MRKMQQEGKHKEIPDKKPSKVLPLVKLLDLPVKDKEALSLNLKEKGYANAKDTVLKLGRHLSPTLRDSFLESVKSKEGDTWHKLVELYQKASLK